MAVSVAIVVGLVVFVLVAFVLALAIAMHMQRVVEQGDFRPMAGTNEAMQDLKGILSAREPFYSRAQYRLDTSQQSLTATFDLLNQLVDKLLNQSIPDATHITDSRSP